MRVLSRPEASTMRSRGVNEMYVDSGHALESAC